MYDITLVRKQDGNLLIQASPEAREEMREDLEERDYFILLGDILEPYSTNGGYTPFDAGQGNPFVGLTEAPCIAEEMTVHDDGTHEIVGDFWYFADYMLRCPIEDLIAFGEVEFQLCKQ